MTNANSKKCNCPHHMMKGVLVILFGLTFLLGAFEVLSQHVVSIVWPILLMLAGVGSLTKGMCKCCDEGHCHIEVKK